jgi:hypothetical protein
VFEMDMMPRTVMARVEANKYHLHMNKLIITGVMVKLWLRIQIVVC